jgi:hypothetical protein
MARNCKWTVEGAGWNWVCEGSTSDLPDEIASLCMDDLKSEKIEVANGIFYSDETNEPLLDLAEEVGVGMVLKVMHDKMKDIGDHHFLLSETVLANAGLYEEADMMKEAMAKLLEE